jgi:hypothetical protein
MICLYFIQYCYDEDHKYDMSLATTLNRIVDNYDKSEKETKMTVIKSFTSNSIYRQFKYHEIYKFLFSGIFDVAREN